MWVLPCAHYVSVLYSDGEEGLWSWGERSRMSLIEDFFLFIKTTIPSLTGGF